MDLDCLYTNNQFFLLFDKYLRLTERKLGVPRKCQPQEFALRFINHSTFFSILKQCSTCGVLRARDLGMITTRICGLHLSFHYFLNCAYFLIFSQYLNHFKPNLDRYQDFRFAFDFWRKNGYLTNFCG